MILNKSKALHGSSYPPPYPPPILGGDLKISDQNYWGGGGGGPEQKIKFGRRELNLRGEPKILGGTYEPQ